MIAMNEKNGNLSKDMQVVQKKEILEMKISVI